MTDLAEAAQETNTQDPGELAHRIVNVASDKKASDIVLLRTAEVTTMTSGTSGTTSTLAAGAIKDSRSKLSRMTGKVVT